MTRRTWLLGVALLTLMGVGGVWAGLALANSRTSTKAVDCCLDPTCPAGCSEVCPPDCTGPAAASTKTAVKCDCCDEPTCPAGCSEECPPNGLTNKTSAKASCCPTEARATVAPQASVKKEYICPPCPFCPGW